MTSSLLDLSIPQTPSTPASTLRPSGLLELLSDPKVDFRVKLMDYSKLRADVAEFTRYYAKWLGAPLTERLKAEISQILEEAVAWCGRQEIYDDIRR